MLVSIIIPVYNSEKHLDKCLKSVLDQTYQTIELIVVDDGSIDTSKKIIQHFAKKDPRIIPVYQENQGTYQTRKTGLDRARGEAIFHLDSDDFLEEMAIEVLVNELQKTNADIIIGNYYQLRNGGKRLIRNHVPKNNSKEELIRSLLLGRIHVFVWGRLYKRSVFHKFQLPITRAYSEDTITNFEIFSKRNLKLSFVDYPIVNYVIHETNVSKSFDLKPVEGFFNEFRYVSAILDNTGFSKSLYREIAFYKCNMWLGYCKKRGVKSLNREYRRRFFEDNYAAAKNHLTLLMKLELHAFNWHPQLGQYLTTFSDFLKKILKM